MSMVGRIIQTVLHFYALIIRHFNTTNGKVFAQHSFKGLFVVHLAVDTESTVDGDFVGRAEGADLLHRRVE